MSPLSHYISYIYQAQERAIMVSYDHRHSSNGPNASELLSLPNYWLSVLTEIQSPFSFRLTYNNVQNDTITIGQYLRTKIMWLCCILDFQTNEFYSPYRRMMASMWTTIVRGTYAYI